MTAKFVGTWSGGIESEEVEAHRPRM